MCTLRQGAQLTRSETRRVAIATATPAERPQTLLATRSLGTTEATLPGVQQTLSVTPPIATTTAIPLEDPRTLSETAPIATTEVTLVGPAPTPLATPRTATIAGARCVAALTALAIQLVGKRPNHAFKPKPLRSTKHMADTACHVLGFTTQLGLT